MREAKKKDTPKDKQGRGWGHDKKASGDPPSGENWRNDQNGKGKKHEYKKKSMNK